MLGKIRIQEINYELRTRVKEWGSLDGQRLPTSPTFLLNCETPIIILGKCPGNQDRLKQGCTAELSVTSVWS